MADSGITISLVQASVSFFAWAPLWAALFIAASGLFHPPIEAAETKDPKQHWAFKSPLRPQVPEVKNKKWVRTPIDNFVLARLDREGLRPSPEADQVTLLRRLSLDVVGLPPTIAEMDAFLTAKSSEAYTEQVERRQNSAT